MSTLHPSIPPGPPARKMTTRRLMVVFGVLSVLAVVFLHIAGVFLAAVCWFITGAVFFGLKIFNGTHRHIARVQAEEAEKIRRRSHE